MQKTLSGNDETFFTATMKNPFSTSGEHDITLPNALSKWYTPNIPLMFKEKYRLKRN